MGRFLFALLLLAATLPSPSARAQTFLERGRDAVVDAANVIPDAEERALARRLTAWQRRTGHQLVVATVPSLQDRTIAEYAVGLFRHWRLGGARTNDGILLLHAPTERRVRIEVGYGLEGAVTDAASARIIREAIVPLIDKQPGVALTAGAEEIMAAAGAPAPAASATPARLAGPPPVDEGPSVFWVLLISFTPALLIVGILFWLFRRARALAPTGPVRPLSKRALARRAAQAAAGGGGAAAWDSGSAFAYQHLSSDSSSSSSYDSSSSSSDSSWSSSDSGGFDSGGGSSGGGGSDSSY
ncbi:MAG TPA: TPM domain-containing protein [Allosphingosinicella sp.]|nr:TPM domain-containing protein [Allosphingosinicella sp.]